MYMKIITSIKLDKEIKSDATQLARNLGLSLSSVVNATLKQFVNERRVVFSATPQFNKEARKEFLLMKKDVAEGKNISKVFTNTTDLKKALLK